MIVGGLQQQLSLKKNINKKTPHTFAFEKKLQKNINIPYRTITARNIINCETRYFSNCMKICKKNPLKIQFVVIAKTAYSQY